MLLFSERFFKGHYCLPSPSLLITKQFDLKGKYGIQGTTTLPKSWGVMGGGVWGGQTYHNKHD